MIKIDLNSDVGEGVGNENQLMPYLTSCNIACGGHAGNAQTMGEMLAFAKAYNVKIGAHPSYPDKANFGRKVMDISSANLRKAIREQILTLQKIATDNNQKVHHIKPHGALYNLAAIDKKTATIIIDCILEIDDSLVLFAPYHSVILEEAKGKLRTAIEGFADRAYQKDYTLVSREKDGAVFTDPDKVVSQVLGVIKHQEILTLSGNKISFNADTFCIHSDTASAGTLVNYLHKAIKAEGILMGL